MSDKKQNIQAQPPENLTGIKLIEVPKKSVGTKAIQSALNHVFTETGVVKGIQLLKNINQLDGFDCPGCVWPDPDQKRAFLAEYCENGAKAIAEEATTNRVSPLFFATHTVQELSEWSDYEIGKSGRITHPMILREGATNYEEISMERSILYYW
ncbi:hypothetical protein PG913_05750 [Tenacibaculum pacificus]|uniref:hypothetical protein n=1 Tax=Tenacibaculum pacificus TaxID=3018314 RepID=UPI0022F3DD23|nr:hypothetical protein [Tenacibaculum pacificus]WBX74674.1 hypothetical protein PG913_05750 [Tenacibaculum pacificus]